MIVIVIVIVIVISTNGAAAKVMTFDRLGKKVRPGSLGKIKVGEREYPKKSLCRKTCIFRSDPISADPICPFPNAADTPGMPETTNLRDVTSMFEGSLKFKVL